jgi:hypothetical protein
MATLLPANGRKYQGETEEKKGVTFIDDSENTLLREVYENI